MYGSQGRAYKTYLIVLCGVIHGLIYIFMIPAWQHYDEPSQLEYAWLISKFNTIPSENEFDNTIRKSIAKSMVENNFYEGNVPDLEADKVDVGFSQVGDPPLYYLLGSVLITIFQSSDAEVNLYLLRFFSFCLFISTLFLAIKISRLILAENHPGNFLIPITLALLPPFVDNMTSVNNDAMAIFSFTFFLWANLKLFAKPSLKNAAVVVLVSVLCFLSKRNLWLPTATFPIWILFSFLKGSRIKIKAAAFFLAAFVAGVLLLFSFDDAAYWYRITEQDLPTRTEVGNTAEKLPALQMKIQKDIFSAESLRQIVPLDDVKNIQGKELIIEAQIWANQPASVRGIRLITENSNRLYSILNEETLSVGTEAAWIRSKVTVPETTVKMWVELSPQVAVVEKDTVVYYRNISMFESKQDSTFSPSEYDRAENLIRNGSGEIKWPRFAAFITKYLRIVISQPNAQFSGIISLFLDPEATFWYTEISLARLMRTFWGTFGWGHVGWLGSKPYRMVTFFTLACLSFFVVGIILKIKNGINIFRLPYLLFASTLIIVWLQTFLAGVLFYSLINRVSIPVARYAFPAIIPTTFMLVLGYHQIFRVLKGNRYWGKIEVPLYLLWFVIIDAWSFLSIYSFYLKGN